MGMTFKQRRFCEEFLTDCCAAKAAERSGYSKKTARTQGSALLTKVDIQQEIKRLMDAQAKRTEITTDRVLKEIALVAFQNPQDLFRDGELINVDELDEPVAKTIAGFKRKEMSIGENGTLVTYDIKLAEKLKALDQIARHLGMFNPDKSNQDINILINPQWLAIQNVIVDSLSDFPAARKAVVLALRGVRDEVNCKY